MKTFKNGFSGGSGGTEFIDDALPTLNRVQEIRIRSGKRIDALQIIHKLNDGTSHEFPQHGGNGGQLRVFTLDDDEYITGISGRVGSRVDSIRIHTNKQTSSLYGGSGGKAEYHYEAPDNVEIIGFYGRSGGEIDAIGVEMRNRTH